MLGDKAGQASVCVKGGRGWRLGRGGIYDIGPGKPQMTIESSVDRTTLQH